MAIVVIGGGAAGFFSAIRAKECDPSTPVFLLEKTNQVLSKVKISGGGRCNVTHACFDPKKLIQNYPRGGKELLGPFHHFGPQDTVEWFEKRGVALKTEKDGRMFPTTDSSQSIVDVLMREAKKWGVVLQLQSRIEGIEHKNQGFLVGDIEAKKVVLATGSARQGFEWAAGFGHTIVPPVPSLFTFNCAHFPLKDLSGVSVEDAEVSVEGLKFRGPVLITHFGLSGPAVLKLSAWAARELHEKAYCTEVKVAWVPKGAKEGVVALRQGNRMPFDLPKNLWKRLLSLAGIDPQGPFHSLTHLQMETLTTLLEAMTLQLEGKTTHKEEFVTCGGISLKEINFKTMESRLVPGLHFAGEILNIDGVTGGFNFQNAWTTGYLAGSQC